MGNEDAGSSLAEPTKPPVPPVQMVHPFPDLIYDPHYDRSKPWCAPRRQCTAEEVAEVKRRNNLYLRPEDVSAAEVTR
jgi:hypothetical protein